MGDDKQHQTPPEQVGDRDLRRGEEIQKKDGRSSSAPRGAGAGFRREVQATRQ
jgi:hypothetical protein